MSGRKLGSKNKNPRLSEAQMKQLITSYEAGTSTIELGAKYGVHNATISTWLKNAGIARREKGFRRGEHHPGWVGGRHEGHDGYVRLWVTRDSKYFSMAQKHSANGGYALEHRIVMAMLLDRPLEPHESVHHIDGNRQNNHIDNLQLRQGRHGKGSAYCCAECGSTNLIPVPLLS